MADKELENATALLQSTQRLRTHWSGCIVRLIQYAVTLTIAIWGFFLKSYIEKPNPAHILVASALSAVVLGLWRLYAHYIDDKIAGLYPDFILYEGKLSGDPNHGTTGYLMRAVPKIDKILSNDLSPEEKARRVLELVKSKQMGTRGHLGFDIFASVIIVIMLMASVLVFLINIIANLSLEIALQFLVSMIGFIAIAVGFFLTLFGILFYHRNPSERCIGQVASIRRENAKGAVKDDVKK